jgi:hypothetical protein
MNPSVNEHRDKKNRNAYNPHDRAGGGAPSSGAPLAMSGLAGLIAATRRYIDEDHGESGKVVQRLAEDFSYIRLQDMVKPYQFLRQMEGNPPIQLGTKGFRRELVDDHNPARHYMAFVAMGYWLPYLLAIVVLYLWEIAGYVRYGFQWSPEDMRSGWTGVRHGNAVRHQGIEVLPGLMVADLAADSAADQNEGGGAG